MTDIIELNPCYSTTRRITKASTKCMFKIVKQFNKPEHKFKTVLFLPVGEGRQGEGGLRTKGYFKLPHCDFEKQCDVAISYQIATAPILITVVTVVFNGEKFLEETILSIINQTYENLEYIIIDGGSTDGTLDIIRKYEHAIDYWVSENDKGISDAFNKAVKVSLGTYINFQGDGDGFCSNRALDEVFSNIDDKKDIFITARIRRTSEEGETIYKSKFIKSFRKGSLLLRMSMPHQGLFTHKDYFKNYGLFDINNKFCMDYEHLLRSYKEFPKVVTRNIVLANWRADGLGNGRTLEILQEYDKIKRDNKVASILLLNLINYWVMLKFFLKKGLSLGK